MIPRSSADILASAKRIEKKKKARKAPVPKADPFASDSRFAVFPSNGQDPAIPGMSASAVTMAPVHNAEQELQTHTYPTTFKFEPEITPENYAIGPENESNIFMRGNETLNNISSSNPGSTVSPLHTSDIVDTSTPLNIRDRTLHAKCIEDAMRVLRNGRISPFDLFLEILDGANPDLWEYRRELYKDSNTKLGKLLDAVLADSKGKGKLYQWMRPHSLDVVREEVTREMDMLPMKERLTSLESITPEVIENWQVSKYQEVAPYLYSVISTAAETSVTKEKKTHAMT